MAYTDPNEDKEYQRCYQRIYRSKHKEYLKKQRERYAQLKKIKTTCECGAVVRRDIFTRHLETLKHQEYEFNKINDQ